mgnify:FL=1
MWTIQSINCENFISFQEAGLNIAQNVCTLIYGINNDNMQQRNNGTGKSSIIEAIAFALTGEPLRQVDKAEEIINDNSDTAKVFMELFNDYDKTHFTIQRTLNRKTSQVIECHKYDENNNEIEQERTSQPTVADYNRYILEEIGLTKDDIYSNFILSNSKYKSFFEASDKTKKAMINRFSGADKIDEVIEVLQRDKQPTEEALTTAKENKIAIEAKLEVVEGQLADVDNKKAEWAAAKEERIANIGQQIAQKREELRETKDTISKARIRLVEIDKVGDYIEDELQQSTKSLADIYDEITSLFVQHKLEAIKDYVSINQDSEKSIADYQARKESLDKELSTLQTIAEEAESELEKQQKQLDKMQTAAKTLDEETEADIKDIKQDIENARKEGNKLAGKFKTVRQDIDEALYNIHSLQNQIRGAITCPKCKHEFFVDSNITLEEAKAQLTKEEKSLSDFQSAKEKLQTELEQCEKQQAGFEDELNEANEEIRQRASDLSKMRRTVSDCNAALEQSSTKVAEMQRRINTIQNSIDVEQGKVDGLIQKMISDALGVVDCAYDKGYGYIASLQDKCVAIEASIESFEKAIDEVKNAAQDDFVTSLNNSKAKYEKELQEALKSLQEAQDEFDKYVVQENHFVDFRSYLANKKVRAISGVTNHFLELIGSDLRVEMLGFKKLKNGKVRDKITVNLLRNGIDCGSYAKFSGGERARVNLASILGLQKLVNNSAPKGKGLDLIIIDEVLEASDTTGIESSCAALNKLKVTSLMVTQNPISDNEGHTIVVTKENGYSTITEQ